VNVHVPQKPDLTQAAEGFSRRVFTVKDVLRMQKTGVIGPDEKFELVEGEIVPMQSKTHVHELIKSDLNLRIARALPDDLWLGVESSMYLSDRTILEPDLVIYKRGLKLETIKGPDIILAIEVALTTLTYDRGLKASLYAKYGVQELWVIDAKKRRAFVHKAASAKGWGAVSEHGPKALMKCAALPGFEVRLGEI
jgi:Uma2 family endonuclease